MNIPSIIDHNYYVLKGTTTNSTWICEAKRFDDRANKLYYYYGTYDLNSNEHINNYYLSDSYYDILSSETDEIRLATYEEIEILMNILEKNGIVTKLQEAQDKAKAPDLKGEDYSGKRFGYKIPDGYELDSVDNGEIILKPIKPKYPTTYVGCAKIMNCPIDGPSIWLFNFDANIKNTYYRKIDILMGKFIRLRICRDAYWKIAGEEMGLGKPWEPNWIESSPKYTITFLANRLITHFSLTQNYILAFPTEEMRDVFYENFKDLIEQCKELL